MSLDFADIASLVNHSRITSIDPEPQKADPGKWALYRGKNTPPGFSYPFSILYLYAGCTKEALLAAAKAIQDPDTTQVIYAPALHRKFNLQSPDGLKEVEHLLRAPRRLYSTRDYLFAFMEEHLSTYRARLNELAPAHFVDPRVEVPVGVPRRTPNPLLAFFRDVSPSDSAGGSLSVLLAEPGQGKTYMTRRLAVKVTNLIPIYIHSEQWYRMGVEESSSLSSTIIHSFRYFETPIGWIGGAEGEFLAVTLKAGLFCIIFDGFDEYVLWNRGHVDARESLAALEDLARNTGARILITSRTSFWETEVASSSAERRPPHHHVYKLLPFDRNHAGNYFQERFDEKPGGPRTRRAMDLYVDLSRGTERTDAGNLVGRGFIINLIADLVERTETNPPILKARGSVTDWVMSALCEREVTRQRLPIAAGQQLAGFQFFAEEVAGGELPTSDLLRFALGCSASLEDRQLDELVGDDASHGKLADHPLIRRRADGLWEFAQEQVLYSLLTSRLLDYLGGRGDKLGNFVEKTLLDGRLRAEIAMAAVERTCSTLGHDRAKLSIASLTKTLLSGSVEDVTGDSSDPRRALATSVALLMVDRITPPGALREDRLAELRFYLADGGNLTGLHFSGVVRSLDFCGVTFRKCRFDQVTWINCVFDDRTIFDSSRFVGGRVDYCEGFGQARWISGWLDADARSLITAEQVKEGKKEYGRDDLKNDISHVLRKFVPKEGFGLKTIEQQNLRRGSISNSLHRDAILDALLRNVLERHHLSGVVAGGVNVREAARTEVLHFAGNGVFTGALARTFDELCQELRI